jgi:uncharacterized protein YjeT (DUF2065 family)
MQNAMSLAAIFGPLLMILGIWMLFYHENMMKMLTSLKNSPAVLFLLGFISLLIGLTIITQYDGWDWSLYLLMTLLGWFYVIRGILIFFVPQAYLKWSTHNENWLKIKGVIPLIWGFGLCWLGYWS